MSDARAAARALDALRRGWPVRIVGEGGALAVLAVETADDQRLAEFDPERRAGLLLSSERAAILKLANQRDAATPGIPVLIDRVPWLDLPAALALADPAHDLANPLKGPYRTRPVECGEAASAALLLARTAGLLPAMFALPDGQGEARVAAGDIATLARQDGLTIAARARLPVAGAEDAEIVAFRARADAAEHVALVIGSPNGSPPLVRLHSECLTGDVLGSLKCDCGPQLHAAVHAIADAGWGILLYLRQEGRGIGLVNKLRAYALQDQGYDTVESNLRLGFAIDARDFSVAAAMLCLLNQDRVRLLTNNPAKVAGLEAAGVAVTERVPHALPPNPHNAHYLAVKRDRTGHLL
ncbi:GTP cyclohydrolase II [Sphingomonas sp.]|uniref:GTP cyclohydrolase II n=1 Tax=Sphingomonas sp. TaxID=28214 RepID=UPI003B3A00D0